MGTIFMNYVGNVTSDIWVVLGVITTLVFSIIGIIYSHLANKKSDLALSVQNFESHFETVVSISFEMWERIEIAATKKSLLCEGNGWNAEYKYLYAFKCHFFVGDESVKSGVKSSFLKEFIVSFYQWGSMILNLYAMVNSSRLEDNEKDQRNKTISLLMSIDQRRLLYIWCILAKRESTKGFNVAESISNDDGTKGVFHASKMWLDEKGWHIHLMNLHKKYDLKD